MFRLPSEKVQQCRQRLTYEAEADPENAVTNDLTIDALHLLERHGGEDHWYLHNHANECNACKFKISLKPLVYQPKVSRLAEYIVSWHANQ